MIMIKMMNKQNFSVEGGKIIEKKTIKIDKRFWNKVDKSKAKFPKCVAYGVAWTGWEYGVGMTKTYVYPIKDEAYLKIVKENNGVYVIGTEVFNNN